MKRDADVAEFLDYIDRVTLDARADAAFERSIVSGIGDPWWRPSDLRSAESQARDARIAAYRSGWIERLGEADGALATACAWPGTEGARVV